MSLGVFPGRCTNPSGLSVRSHFFLNGPTRLVHAASPKPRLLDEDHIEALREFADDNEVGRGYYLDSKVFGLTIFLGAKSTVWRFRQQGRSKGKRSSVFKTLGNWPAMDEDEARKQALIYSGAVAAGCPCRKLNRADN